MEIIGRFGESGAGRVLIGLDDQWLVAYEEALGTVTQPERIQSFFGKFRGKVRRVSDEGKVLSEILRQVEIPGPPLPVIPLE